MPERSKAPTRPVEPTFVPAVSGSGQPVPASPTQVRSEDNAVAERSVLEAIDHGDQVAALNALMKAYGKAVYQYCRYMVADVSLAEDAHQLTFLQAFEHLPSYERRSSVRAWLFGIARHRCLDLLKATRRRNKRFVPLEDLSNPPAGGRPEDDRLIARGIAETLDECLRRLAPHARAAVVLRYQQSLSFAEMAQALGKRPATLQMRVARALPVLRRCLQERGLTL
jgi:RNA polymerase sigma-70 factor (ECF subfamily)